MNTGKPTPELIFRCPYGDACGGCGLNRLPYAEQLANKQALVARLLKPYGAVEPIRGMAMPLFYRNKVHAVFAEDRRGTLVSGVYRQGTHRVVPVERCLIEDRRAQAIIATVRSLARDFGYPAFDEDRGTGFLRHALVRAGKREIMLVLVTAALAFPHKTAFLKALLLRHPEITTVVQNVNDRHTSMVLGRRMQTLHGKGYIEDTLCGMTFRISPASFYQVNSVQTEVLYALAAEMADLHGTETVVDAYCGVGTIGLSMAARCGRLIGVELNAAAVRDAQGNAKRNEVVNARFFEADAGRFLQQCALDRATVDVLLMDPPRTGSDSTFLNAVLSIRPAKVVYISCDPATLARDVQVLVKGGYAMRRAVPVDMFPATEHVEVAVQLVRT
jgi:23S rRNA (uracil1939-C5)-methyltransferase